MDNRQRLGKAMDEIGYSTISAAKASGLSQKTFSNLLSGRHEPTTRTIEKLENTFGRIFDRYSRWSNTSKEIHVPVQEKIKEIEISIIDDIYAEKIDSPKCAGCILIDNWSICCDSVVKTLTGVNCRNGYIFKKRQKFEAIDQETIEEGDTVRRIGSGIMFKVVSQPVNAQGKYNGFMVVEPELGGEQLFLKYDLFEKKVER